jgi:hypothetical protein
MAVRRDARRAASVGWHGLTAVLIALCIVAQLILTFRGDSVLVDENGVPVAGLPLRLLRFLTYFTIQSNLLAMITAASLAVRPDRDGSWWRVTRVGAVVGMTVTFVVYLVALAPILDLSGVAFWTDLGFHVAAPILTVGGWLLFGPWPRLDRRSVAWFVGWPVCWIIYVLALGAGTDWYPYPFLDVHEHGYRRVLANCLLVAVLLLGLAAVFSSVDARLGGVRPVEAGAGRQRRRRPVRGDHSRR